MKWNEVKSCFLRLLSGVAEFSGRADDAAGRLDSAPVLMLCSLLDRRPKQTECLLTGVL